MTTAPSHSRLRLDDALALTTHDIDVLLKVGVIPEDASTEHLDGVIVRKDRAKAGAEKMTIGNDHTTSVELFRDLGMEAQSAGAHVRSQQPLSLTPLDTPEPDAMVVRGRLKDFKDRPTAADVSCVVEVADSSLQFDRTVKLSIYAEAGIGQYLIVNLVDRVIERYEGPQPGEGGLARYGFMQTHRPGESLAIKLPNGSKLDVAVNDLLP